MKPTTIKHTLLSVSFFAITALALTQSLEALPCTNDPNSQLETYWYMKLGNETSGLSELYDRMPDPERRVEWRPQGDYAFVKINEKNEGGIHCEHLLQSYKDPTLSDYHSYHCSFLSKNRNDFTTASVDNGRCRDCEDNYFIILGDLADRLRHKMPKLWENKDTLNESRGELPKSLVVQYPNAFILRVSKFLRIEQQKICFDSKREVVWMAPSYQ